MGLDMYMMKTRRGESPESGSDVGYWRKANAIHNWFVENVQDGEDDCEFHREVTAADLEKLKAACETILKEAVLVEGMVQNGFHLANGKMEPFFQPGKVIMNPEVCEANLPTVSGFFFGGRQYNEWYLNDIRETYELCERLLEETDFEQDALFYVSSW